MKKQCVSRRRGTFLLQGERAGARAPRGVYLCSSMPGGYEKPRFQSINGGSGTLSQCMSHQMSIMVIPGVIQLLTYERTCRCASAASLKSLHISSLAPSSARFSSLVVRHAALRLAGGRRAAERRNSLFSHHTHICNQDMTHVCSNPSHR